MMKAPPSGTVSSTLRSGLFWVGFLSVALLLSYNACCQAGWLRGLTPIELGFNQSKLQEMLSHSVFKGIADEVGGGTYRLRILIIFTAIGISFLIPLEISASIWIYYLVSVVLFLVAFWTAAGATVKSFPQRLALGEQLRHQPGGRRPDTYSAAALAKMAAERAGALRQSAAVRPQPEHSGVGCETAGEHGLGRAALRGSCAVAIGWLAWCNVSWYWMQASWR